MSLCCRKNREFLQKVETYNRTVPMEASNSIPASSWVRKGPKMHCVLPRPEFKPFLHSCGAEVWVHCTGVIHTNWSVFDTCFQSKHASLWSFHQQGTFYCSKGVANCRGHSSRIISSLPSHHRVLWSLWTRRHSRSARAKMQVASEWGGKQSSGDFPVFTARMPRTELRGFCETGLE